MGSSTDASSYLPSQLRIFLLAMMLIVGVGGIVASVAKLLLDGDSLSADLIGTRVAVVVALGVGFWTIGLHPDNTRLHRAIDVGAPVLLSVAPIFALLRGAPFLTSDLVLLAVAVALCLRAALVPSTALRTAAIGTLAMTPVLVLALFSGTTARSSGLVLSSGLMFFVVTLIATTAMSHVVYGLRRRLRLGPYELGRLLGEGGMGLVYQAKHALLRRPTAIKVIRGVGPQSTAAKRFEREAQLTSALTHPNIVSLFDYGCSPEGVYYYAMELVDGLTLHEVVTRSGPLCSARAAHVLRQLAAALEAAHAADLIHRDIKPANVMLCGSEGSEDLVKVLDFGLAKRLDAVDGITREGAVIGTPTYLAPEVAWGNCAGSKTADVYAFGVLAYFILTGSPPFSGATTVQLARSHAFDSPVPPSLRCVQELPSYLDELVLRCLAKDPAERFADGAELAAALSSWSEAPAWTRSEIRTWWSGVGAVLVTQRERKANKEVASTELRTAIDLSPTLPAPTERDSAPQQTDASSRPIPLLLGRRLAVEQPISADKTE